MKKYNIIALIGKAGSGKDTILKLCLDKNTDYHNIISCTSRPMREGEVEGFNYYYLTKEEFENKIENNEMVEWSNFNNWYYGISKDSLKQDKINIGVFNPTGIRSLLDHPEVNLKVFYIQAGPKTRLVRQLIRENHPDVDEIVRRYGTDERDFSTVDFDYIELLNEELLDAAYCADSILLAKFN